VYQSGYTCRMRWTVCLVAITLAGACTTKEEEEKPPPPCVPDEGEPNDSVAEATSLGALQDDAELGQKDAAPTKVMKAFTTHTETDVDWYTVDVRDTGLGGNPQISVIVGDGHEATAFWSCTNGPTESVRCPKGTLVTDDPDLPSVHGCVTVVPAASVPPQLGMQIECADTPTDSGKLQIRVKRTAPADTCERYTLTVVVE